MKKDINKLIKEITPKIENLLIKLINQENSKDYYWKERYEGIVEDLNYELKNINELREDCEENNLTFSKIEAEGYKRCLVTIIEKFKYEDSLERSGE